MIILNVLIFFTFINRSINSFTLTQEDINTVCNLNNLETL